MSKDHVPFNPTWGRLLVMLGLGAAGTAVGAVTAPDGVFATQFARSGIEFNLPEMTYDPELQMMVNPVTRQPIYEKGGEVAARNPTVTAGCKTCPKCDDYCG